VCANKYRQKERERERERATEKIGEDKTEAQTRPTTTNKRPYIKLGISQGEYDQRPSATVEGRQQQQQQQHHIIRHWVASL